ncbi:MAG: class I SAM-dependent methyltransferase [Alphaproteobacteria bacterium]|nr:class I SAM-dependent methyltransferase [Alphaproteobacteria bacterium]
MSRLDSFIRRMEAQRACLNAASRLIDNLPGPILELGLGNGRTYDHLRELFPARDIYVFDRQVAAHPDCIPDDDHMFVGEVVDRLPDAAARLGKTAALVHSDIGSGRPDTDAILFGQVIPLLNAIMRPGGLVLSDQKLPAGDWHSLSLPDGVPAERYFMYMVGA